MLQALKAKGYSDSDIILGMINVLKLSKFIDKGDQKSNSIDSKLSEAEKMYMLSKVSNTAYVISRGINTDLQVYACVAGIMDGYRLNNISM